MINTQNVWPGQSGGGDKPVGLVMLDGIMTLLTEHSVNGGVWEWRIVQPWIEYPGDFSVVASVPADYTIHALVARKITD